MNVRAREMAAAIRTETNGRVDLQIFPNNQLGSDTDMLSQIRSGGVEFFTLSGLILATLVPAASINGRGAPVQAPENRGPVRRDQGKATRAR